MDDHPSLPTEPHVQRADDAEWLAFSSTDAIRFLAEGGVGLPDLFVERAARGDGPPMHHHPWSSWEIVVEGRIRFALGEETVELGEGDAVYIPGGTVHGFVVVSDTAQAISMNLSDGRFPLLQRRAAPLRSVGDGSPDLAAIRALAADHGVTAVGPPMSLDGDQVPTAAGDGTPTLD